MAGIIGDTMIAGDSVKLLSSDIFTRYLTGYLEVDNVYVVDWISDDGNFIMIIGCPYMLGRNSFRKVVWSEQASYNG